MLYKTSNDLGLREMLEQCYKFLRSEKEYNIYKNVFNFKDIKTLEFKNCKRISGGNYILENNKDYSIEEFKVTYNDEKKRLDGKKTIR